ncbi:helix-turn-helix domain-containing protein [Pseudonocardia phyllosphaerae]|uniref:helix-turn-helix domain-containing protein n=1 Tax=Pseudonocardia phyllosphaerae TaxID=3390502 RepID=UPI00397D1C59
MSGSPLGDFLRSRRDGARPENFGLPVGPRRRAPGLRRSELAVLAGMSVEYLVRIEQGRDRNPSVPVINALADALRLDDADRDYLRRLAKITEGSECIGLPPRRDDVRAGVWSMLALLEPGLALVLDPLGAVLAHTSSFATLAAPSGLLDSDRPDLTRYVLADPRARDVFPDRDRVADERVAELWLGATSAQLDLLRTDLPPAARTDLAGRLGRHPRRAGGMLRWRRPEGVLHLDRETLEIRADAGQQLLVLLPADDATAELLRQILGGRPLRAVPGSL